MKFIISHDIDHFYWSDHIFKDLFIPKFVLKNVLFFVRGQIPPSLFLSRLKALATNRFGRLAELVDFNKKNEVPGSFFMGVRNALNLSYDLATAEKIASMLAKEGCPLYLHGIAYDEMETMKKEKETFRRLVPQTPLGIRMHYLRNSANTLQHISALGYDFDSTLYELRDPFFIDQTLEFPVSMMEVYMLQYNDTDFEKIKVATEKRIRAAQASGLKYFTVIFHDHHFSETFPLHKKWYEWLITSIKTQGHEFTTFADALRDIIAQQKASQTRA